jgi:hypothetical protein
MAEVSAERAEQVYFIRVGKFIKIGYTTNLKRRIKSFEGASNERIEVLAVFPGDRRAEKYLHDLFSADRLRNEFFRDGNDIFIFLLTAKNEGLRAALKWAKEWKAFRNKTPEEKKEAKQEAIWKEREQAARRRRSMVPMYPEEWNEARLEANRRKQP